MSVTTPVVITETTTVDNTYKEIHVSASGEAVDVLLSAADCDDTQEFYIKCVDLTHAATVTPEQGSINGLPSFSFVYKNESIRLKKNGSSDSWQIIQREIESETSKIYRALLSQSGTDAPTAVILENTLGEVPTFSYSAPGVYLLTTVAPLFVVDKTSPIPGSGVSGYQVGADRYDDNTIEIWSLGETYIPANEILSKTPLIITIDP